MRAVTGVGAALIFPATLSIITNVFTEPVERQKAIAIWASTAGIGIALGPLAGGVLLEHFYWGSIFLVNLPVIVAGARRASRSPCPSRATRCTAASTSRARCSRSSASARSSTA